jgi:hypothetical protein
MSDELLPDFEQMLARFLAGEVSAHDRESFLAVLERNPAGLEKLLLIQSMLELDSGSETLPFQPAATLALGYHAGFLRMIHHTGFLLGSRLERFSRILDRLGSSHLPLCPGYEVQVRFEDREIEGSIGLHVICSRQGDLELRLEPRIPSRGQWEIWRQGSPWRMTSHSGPVSFSLPHSQGTESLGIRHSDSPVGVRLVWLPHEMGRNDWLSACYYCVVTGDLPRGLDILRENNPFPPAWSEGLGVVLDAIGSVTKSVNLTLQPLPLTRNPTVPIENRRRLYRLVWDGLTRIDSRIASIPSPWTDSPAEAAPNSQLGEEMLLLIANLCRASEEGVLEEHPSPQEIPDPGLREAWLALLSCWHLLSRRYDAARRMALLSSPSHGDPFRLASLAILSSHLSEVEQEDFSGDRLEASSDFVWKMAFPPLMK